MSDGGSSSSSSIQDSTTDTVAQQTVLRDGRRSPFEAIFDRDGRVGKGKECRIPQSPASDRP